VAAGLRASKEALGNYRYRIGTFELIASSASRTGRRTVSGKIVFSLAFTAVAFIAAVSFNVVCAARPHGRPDSAFGLRRLA
jgi:hypothetical protein